MTNIVIHHLKEGLKNAIKNNDLKSFNPDEIKNKAIGSLDPGPSKTPSFGPANKKVPVGFNYWTPALKVEKTGVSSRQLTTESRLMRPFADSHNKRYIKELVDSFFDGGKNSKNLTIENVFEKRGLAGDKIIQEQCHILKGMKAAHQIFGEIEEGKKIFLSERGRYTKPQARRIFKNAANKYLNSIDKYMNTFNPKNNIVNYHELEKHNKIEE